MTISATPTSSSVRPATSMPTSATTPPRPISSPTSRMPDARSAASNRIASSATTSGTVAMTMAATDEDTRCSPAASSGNGIAISTAANSASQRQRPRSVASRPACAASASRITAPSASRDQATNAGGTPSSTATLIRRYGMPQMTDMAAKAAHPRGLTGSGPRPRRQRDQLDARVERERRRVDDQVIEPRILRLGAVEVAHIGVAGAVGLLEMALGGVAVHALERHALLHALVPRPGEAHVQRARAREHDRRRAPEDHGAGPGGVLADDLLGRPPLVLAARLGRDARRRRAERHADMPEPARHAGQRSADVLVARERLAQGHRQPLGAADRDRAVHERHFEPPRQLRPHLAAARAVRRRQGHDRHRPQDMGRRYAFFFLGRWTVTL